VNISLGNGGFSFVARKLLIACVEYGWNMARTSPPFGVSMSRIKVALLLEK